MIARPALTVFLGIWLAAGPADAPPRGSNDPSPARLHEMAQDDLQAGRAARAADRFSVLIERDPADGPAIEGYVEALLALGRWREALVEVEAHRLRLPTDVHVRSGLGQALYRAGEFERAAETLGPLADAESAPLHGLATLALVRDAEGRDEDAAQLALRVVQQAPDDRRVLSIAAGLVGDRGLAADWLRRYLDVSGGDDAERIEAARGMLRFYDALGDRPVWVAGRQPERVELPLTRLWDPASGRIRGYVVRAQIGAGRKPVPLLLDTGSPRLFLVERVARKRGFEPLAERTAFGGGGDRRHATRQGIVPSVRLGALEFSDALVMTTTEELEPTGRFHGLLGLAALQGYRVTLDLDARRMVLEREGAPVDGARYWTVAGQMLVRARAAGTPGLFLFDTGAGRTLLDLGFAERLEGVRLFAASGVRAFGGRLAEARAVDGGEITFQGWSSGGRRLAAADLSMRSRLGGVEVAGFLGLDLLGGSRIEVDTVGQRLRVSGRPPER